MPLPHGMIVNDHDYYDASALHAYDEQAHKTRSRFPNSNGAKHCKNGQ